MRLIGPPTASRESVLGWLDGGTLLFPPHRRFLQEMFNPLWDAAVDHTIDPVGVIAQAYKETGGGTFRGRVKPEHYNTAGIKVRHPGYGGPATEGDEQLAHAAFASWDVGALAHVQHCRAYAGWPVEGLIVDPRYWLVIGKHRCENWYELGTRWAPSPSYGAEIEATMRKLQGVS